MAFAVSSLSLGKHAVGAVAGAAAAVAAGSQSGWAWAPA